MFFADNLKVLLKLTGNTYINNGAEYARINEVKFILKPGTIRVRFENLFNGQKDLENVANEVINQNINLITDDVIPQIERALERKTIVIANQFFEKAPLAEFFP
jgi:Haemolymph juvenile hormone binding protein (JHBP)